MTQAATKDQGTKQMQIPQQHHQQTPEYQEHSSKHHYEASKIYSNSNCQKN